MTSQAIELNRTLAQKMNEQRIADVYDIFVKAKVMRR